MIRVYAIEDTLDDEGGLTLVVTGHASKLVCAGMSAIWRTALAGIAEVARNYPGEVTFNSQRFETKVTERKLRKGPLRNVRDAWVKWRSNGGAEVSPRVAVGSPEPRNPQGSNRPG
jgi:hypothetical protein